MLFITFTMTDIRPTCVDFSTNIPLNLFSKFPSNNLASFITITMPNILKFISSALNSQDDIAMDH